MMLGIYNGLIRSRVRTREAWSGIDVQLKRRASLIPNLVETVKGYASSPNAQSSPHFPWLTIQMCLSAACVPPPVLA